jgi:hypothetical protein
MPSDLIQLRAELSKRRRRLSQLDVVEAAELAVRQELKRCTDAVLEELNKELSLGQELLASSWSTNDLGQIADAEDKLCAIKRHLVAVEGQASVQREQLRRQRYVYLAARNAELRHIRGMEQLIDRIQRQPQL